MNRRKNFAFTISLSLLLLASICNSCNEFSGLSTKPFVMATAATYTETSQGPPLLRFTIVYWTDDISGLEINIFNPDGDLAKTWQQPSGVLSSGTPIKIDQISKKTGEWRLTYAGKVETNNDNKGARFEDENIVSVKE